ncbi:hypothetical protein niasHT_025424 [Heterodera trifolii]|uniref:Uncharacterized protein n=1 Tax=Heterodera trifolii TaxID=157864 RepID=A0ABD2JWW2_9BILA
MGCRHRLGGVCPVGGDQHKVGGRGGTRGARRKGRATAAEGRDDAGRGGDEEQQHFGLHKIAAISTTSGSCGEADQSPSPPPPPSPRLPASPAGGAVVRELSCRRRQSTRKRQPTAAAPGIDGGRCEGMDKGSRRSRLSRAGRGGILDMDFWGWMKGLWGGQRKVWGETLL